MEIKILNRFKKLQRKKSTDGVTRVTDMGGRPKKVKGLCWTLVPEQLESDEVIQTAVASIKQEWKKSKKNHDNIKEHMKTTYSKRRAMVVHDMKPIMEIVEMFPPLQNILYVSIVYLCLVNNLSLMFKVAVISVVFKGGWYLSRVILTP